MIEGCFIIDCFAGKEACSKYPQGKQQHKDCDHSQGNGMRIKGLAVAEKGQVKAEQA
jgi:hypothetical protein